MESKHKINDIAMVFLNNFMEEKLDEMRCDLQKIKDIQTIRAFLEEQKVIVLSFCVSEFSIMDNNEKEKFESLKRQYLTLFDLYLDS
ncbi:hypothetical protein VSVS12_02799 [Vibrio scophthalmi]|uniref:hypothetical protein n=1 Tax=Vibrio scophthalmi TaxID=45658 RepID=UPI00080994BF|nr:hypothetical protein [Vibrio scophthalmi]ANS86538.1 hypothetical protein VSVS12_02799 [Vibrio scophthalmi]